MWVTKQREKLLAGTAWVLLVGCVGGPNWARSVRGTRSEFEASAPICILSARDLAGKDLSESLGREVGATESCFRLRGPHFELFFSHELSPCVDCGSSGQAEAVRAELRLIGTDKQLSINFVALPDRPSNELIQSLAAAVRDVLGRRNPPRSGRRLTFRWSRLRPSV
jgi:hypothetical protein